MDVILSKNKRKEGRVSGFVVQAGRHSSTFMMFFLFLSGLIVGSILVRTNNVVATAIVSLFKNYNGFVINNGFSKNFINLMISNGVFIFGTYVMGLCAIGAPVICIIPFIKGIGIGAVSAYLYKNYALSGFGYCMLVYYPAQMLNMFTVMLYTNESYTMSKDIYANIKLSNGLGNENEFRMYHVRYIFFVLLYCVSSLLGGVLNTYLSSIFTF